MNQEDRNSLYLRAIKLWGIEAQTLMVIEEMAELQKALCKFWRSGFRENHSQVVDEIADVEIMLEQLRLILPWSEAVNTAKRQKIERLRTRIELAEKHKGHFQNKAKEAA